MATAVVPKKNYRAALLRPPPPEPMTNIYSPIIPMMSIPGIVDDCIGNVAPGKSGFVRDPEMDVGVMHAVVEFEEEELTQYQTKKGSFNKKFEDTLEWLAKKLNKNVLAFVGHSDAVEDYFQDLNEKLFRGIGLINRDLETIVILVGCYTGEYAYRINNQGYMEEGNAWNSPRAAYNPYAVLAEYPIYFFGFERLMHIYQAELFMCQEAQTNIKSMSCLYPNALEDKEELMMNYDNKTNPLRKCCVAKYDRFKSMFVDDLNTRKCVKFTKEAILAKIQKALKSNGAVDLGKITNANVCMFKPGDGIACPSPGCQIKNPYKGAERYAESFDKAETLMLLGHQLFSYATTNQDEKIANKLQSLKPEEQKVIWMKNFLIPSNVLFFELLNYQRYKAVAACIKSFSIPLSILGIENKTFFSWAADLTDVEEGKIYELFDLLFKKSKLQKYTLGYYLRGYYDVFNRNTLWYILHNRRKMLLEMYVFITEDWANLDHADNNEYWTPALCLVAETYNFDPQFWKYLLAYGANPNAQVLEYAPLKEQSEKIGMTALEYILQLVPPPFEKEILVLLCVYGASSQTALEKEINRFKQCLDIDSEERKIMLSEISISLKEMLESMDLLQEKYAGDVEKLKTDWDYPSNVYLIGKLSQALNYPDKVFLESIDTLELCLRIMKSSPKRKRKIQAKLTEETKQLIYDTISAREKTLVTRNELPKLYKTLNQTLKRPNARIRQNLKKTVRNKGLHLLRNNTQSPENRADKLQELIDMVTGKEPETVSTNNNFVGGKKTRKAYAPRRR